MKRERAEQILATAARRPLCAEETREWQAWLASCPPEERPRWEEEMRLNQLLAGLMQTPAPSNFTARVLHALDRAEAARPAGLEPKSLNLWGRLLRPWALGAAALALAAVVLHLQQQARAREQVVHSAEVIVATATEVPTLQMLRDFEAIYALPAEPPPSVAELEAALEISSSR